MSKRHNRALLIISLAFMCALFALIAVQAQRYFESKDTRDKGVAEIQDDMSNSIRGWIEDLYVKTENDASKYVSDIVSDTNKIYNNDGYKIQRDLELFTEGDPTYTPLLQVLENHTKGVYNVIDSPGNDPWIGYYKIIKGTRVPYVGSDYSPDCLKDSRVRDMNTEVAQHFSPDLARVAMVSMILEGSKRSFWSFSQVDQSYPWYNTIKRLDTDDIDILMYYYARYGYDYHFFKSIEFLTSTPIEKFSDLSGKRVYENGNLNKDSHQLFYIYTFKFYEHLIADKSKMMIVNKYETRLKEFISDSNRHTRDLFVWIIVESLILLTLFLVVASHYDKHVIQGSSEDSRR